ncbi:PilZ domain-containing protein [methane-oxidizing endosymbiont of Gigantopelta aegis]|uniref:PilZ domain-containing protein n=1 Tax=methane-oxidizing endosymbiont of Gigantopelta aegis TaxID=2794938 RepID=UPI0018DD8667|nr:PilZ domain-containing protein [methane-oxidizing endosymbiont of Gigantopelta aegis]
MIDDRAYRKNLATEGLVYISGAEIGIRVINLSITGVLVELLDNDVIGEAKDIFEAARISPVIDIYLPQLRIAGEAEIVRMENKNNSIQIGLEFCHINYEVDHLLYQRKAYRKNLTAPGKIMFHGETYVFTTENVSVEGLMIRIGDELDIHPGTITTYEFSRLDLSGQIKVIWSTTENYTTLMGLEYLYLQKDVEGIPRFFT